MKIVHTLLSRDPDFGLALATAGISYKAGDFWSVELKVDESDPRWSLILGLLSRHDVSDRIETEFSAKEIRAAEWLSLEATGHFGYPQPEDDYMRATYDLADYCGRCGIGAIQQHPFRLRKDPLGKRSHFLQLNWVFDEFFVSTEVRATLLDARISGIDFLEPILHKSAQPIESFAQLRVREVLGAALQTEQHQPVTCKPQNEESHVPEGPGPKRYPPDAPFCGRLKYHWLTRGITRYQRQAFMGAPDIVKSHEWFGSGGAADRQVLVNRRVADLILQRKWRGVRLTPIELVG